MSKEIIDILPPYEDEVLVSWIVRMLRFYLSGKLNYHAAEIMNDLFGSDTSKFPGLYFQRGLRHFIDHCDLEKAVIFQSEDTIMDKVSVLPFYTYFCTEEQINSLNKSDYELYKYLESIIGIRTNHKYLESMAYFKYCPLCLKEQSEVYLKREHQIQGNLVCWKHGCILNRLPYKLEWKYIDFISNIEENINITTPDLPVQCQTTATAISKMVHSVFDNGFQDDLYTLKKKLSNRLFELNITDSKGLFYDLQSFVDSFNADYLYDERRLQFEISVAVGVINNIHINPIIYLFLIYRLFGSLEYYYDYESEVNARLLPKTRIVTKQSEEKVYDIDYYLETYKEKILDEYTILGDTSNEIVVKHLVCGMVYRFSKENKKFKWCDYCKIREKMTDKKSSVSYTRYSSTKEYGKIHGKSKRQIAHLCNKNRIHGVLRIGTDYLIPVDAPYPEDKRFQKQ